MLNMREKGGVANFGLIFPILEVFSPVFRGVFSPFFEGAVLKCYHTLSTSGLLLLLVFTANDEEPLCVVGHCWQKRTGKACPDLEELA